MTVAGFTAIVTAGALELTVTVTCFVTVPPDPVQASANVFEPAEVGVTDCDPLVALVPVHASLAVHEVAFVAAHDSVVLPPRVNDIGLADSVSVGAAALTVRVAELLAVPPDPVH